MRMTNLFIDLHTFLFYHDQTSVDAHMETLERSLVIAHNLAIEKISREVVLRPNEPSHDKVFWKLLTGTTHLLRKFSTFEASLSESRTT